MRGLFLVNLVCILFIGISLAENQRRAPSFTRNYGDGPEVIISPVPWLSHRIAQLPLAYDIRNVSGMNFASPIRSQMVPIYCGSCWAFAVTSSLNDRMKIMRKNAYPDVILAPQAILNCGVEAGTCDGGSAFKAFKWIHDNGITDETCTPYVAADTACTPLDQCRICNDDDTGCEIVTKFPTFSVLEYGYLPSHQAQNQKDGVAVSMVNQMMAEIGTRGPITCSMYTDKVFDAYRGGIMLNRSWKGLDHEVTVSGWGSEAVNGSQVPFWVVRNSFGTWWGEGGWFRIQRGVNALGIESSCAWGVPKPF